PVITATRPASMSPMSRTPSEGEGYSPRPPRGSRDVGAFLTDHADGAGAFFRFVAVASFCTSWPPNRAQWRPAVLRSSTRPTSPANGGWSVMAGPLQVALMPFCVTTTAVHGSSTSPVPLYL